ncbi:MAG: alpha-hydroxy acid oxidase [Rhodobacteraceae bacterium]|nr:alpha-hydroxy acid oxidase [Paracoccaceae bacterium]
MTVITTIEDLKELQRRRVPRMFYDYVESGSWTEQTFRENSDDFDQLRLRQRVARDISGRTTTSRMVGQEVSMPVGLAPVGMAGMQHPDGEIKAAKAAKEFGVPFVLSTMSICSIEDVAKHAHEGFWFQLYVMRDADFVDRLIQRARDANCGALVLTLDLQVLGQRHKDKKHGLAVPFNPSLANIVDLATKVRWGTGMLTTRRRTFGNLVGHIEGVDDTGSLFAWVGQQFDPFLDWDRVARIRDQWDGVMIFKGILDEEDALRAAEIGADAIVVSNHGGRQLDGALSAIRKLPDIVSAVGNRVEVHMDSGIRTGQHVLKALTMGATGTYIGRAYIYGLGAMGQAGVTKALEIIRTELDLSMALCGESHVVDLDRNNVLVPHGFSGHWE